MLWQNSRLLAGDAQMPWPPQAGARRPELVILGSGKLIEPLRRTGLIDTYVLLIHPLVLDSGGRLFAGGTAPADLRITDSVTTTTGVIIATYEPA